MPGTSTSSAAPRSLARGGSCAWCRRVPQRPAPARAGGERAGGHHRVAARGGAAAAATGDEAARCRGARSHWRTRASRCSAPEAAKRPGRGSVGAHPRHAGAPSPGSELRGGRSSPRRWTSSSRRASALSSQLVAAALPARGLPGLAVDARDVFRTDARHGDATVDLAPAALVLARRALWGTARPRRHRVHRPCAGRRHHHPGSEWVGLRSHRRSPRCWGRREVTIWTDVGGRDDRRSGAGRGGLPRPATHLARGPGAGSLRPSHVPPAHRAPARAEPGQPAHPQHGGRRRGHGHRCPGNPDPHRPTCVTSLEHLALLAVESRRAAPETSLVVRVFSALEEAQLRVWTVTQSGHGQSLARGGRRGREAGPGGAGDRAGGSTPAGEVELPPSRDAVTLVSLVAEAMGQRPNVAGRFFAALGNVGINVLAIAQGASSRSISCVVAAADTAEAVRTVHAAFNLAETEVNVLLLGRGTVGGRLLGQLEETRESLRRSQGIATRLFGVVDRHGAHVDPAGIARADLPPRSSAPAGSPPSSCGSSTASPAGRCRCSWTAPPRTGWRPSTSRRSGAASTWWRRTRSRWRSRWSEGPRCPRSHAATSGPGTTRPPWAPGSRSSRRSGTWSPPATSSSASTAASPGPSASSARR